MDQEGHGLGSGPEASGGSSVARTTTGSAPWRKHGYPNAANPAFAAGEPAQVARGATVWMPQVGTDAVPWPVIAEKMLKVSGSAQQPPGSVRFSPATLGFGCMSTACA